MTRGLARAILAISATPALLAAVACNAHPHDSGGPMSSTLLLTWKPHTLPIGLVARILDGEPLAVLGDATRGQVMSGFRPVRAGLSFGPGEDLAHWKSGVGDNPGVQFGSETPTTVCGRPARKLEAVSPTRPASQVSYGSGVHGSEANPGETYVVVAFQYKDVPVLADYIVTTSERQKYAEDEAHFFASIACP